MVMIVAMAAENGAEDDGQDDLPQASKNLVDENLRKLYDDLFEDDVPERFKELLDRLNKQDTDGSGGDS